MPPTRGTDSTPSRGWTQKVVRPATKGPSPRSKSSSVMLGTSETMRGSGPAGGCSWPAQSARSPVTRRRPPRADPLLLPCLAGITSLPPAAAADPLAAAGWTPSRHCYGVDSSSTLRLRRARHVAHSHEMGCSAPFPVRARKRRDGSVFRSSGSEANHELRLPDWGIALGTNAIHVFAMVRTGAGCATARLPGSARRNADSGGPADVLSALWALVERPCRTAMFQNLHSVAISSHLGLAARLTKDGPSKDRALLPCAAARAQTRGSTARET